MRKFSQNWYKWWNRNEADGNPSAVLDKEQRIIDTRFSANGDRCAGRRVSDTKKDGRCLSIFFLAMETTTMVEAGIKTFALPADEWGIDSERWLDLFSNPKPTVPTYYKSKHTLNLTSKAVNQLFQSWMEFRNSIRTAAKAGKREIIKLCCLQNWKMQIGLLLLLCQQRTNRSKCTSIVAFFFHFIPREHSRDTPSKLYFVLSPIDYLNFKLFLPFHDESKQFHRKKKFIPNPVSPMLFTISFPLPDTPPRCGKIIVRSSTFSSKSGIRPRRNHRSRLETPVEIILITRKEARNENGTD